MRRTVAVLAALPGCMIVAAACQPTGSPRCDAVLAPQNQALNDHGWTLDCTPGFPNWSEGQGRYVDAWVDPSSHTVWIWPDHLGGSDAKLRKVGQHEYAHVLGITDEWEADAFSWCTLHQEGVTYLAPLPTPADCHRLGFL